MKTLNTQHRFGQLFSAPRAPRAPRAPTNAVAYVSGDSPLSANFIVKRPTPVFFKDPYPKLRQAWMDER
jgi:hypothetical protein